MRHNRAYLATVTFLTAMPLLAGCIGQGGTVSSEQTQVHGQGTVIKIASAETAAPAMDALKKAGLEYEKETGVKVIFEPIPLADVYTKVNSTWGTSAEYSAFLTGFLGHVTLFESEDRLVPVDDIIDTLGGKSDFYDGQEIYPIKGKAYWVPYDFNLAFGLIRTDWLKEKGLSVPKTWDDLVNVAKAFTDKSKKQYGFIMPFKADSSTDWVTSQLLWANKARILDDNFKVALDSPETLPKTVESMKLLRELHQYMPTRADNATYADLTEAYLSGQVGMTFYTGRVIDMALKQDPSLVDRTQIFGFPMKDGSGVTAGLGGDGLAIFKTKQSDETKKFVTWFYKNKLMDLLATAPFHFFPAQKSIYNSKEWRAIPNVEKYFTKGMEPQLKLIESPNLASIDSQGGSPDFRAGAIFTSELLPEMYQRVAIAGEDPTTVAKDVSNKIRKLIKE